MKQNTDMIIHELEPRTIKVHVLGDCHIGDENCDMDGLTKWIKAIENDPDSYLVIIGDTMNTAIPGSKSEVFGDVLNPKQQMEVFTDLMYNLAKDGRILGIVNGNHEDRIRRATGLSPLAVVAARLGIEDVYREDFAGIRIRMKNKGVDRTWSLLAFHGASNAKTEKMAFAASGFDALLTGHTHTPAIFCQQQIVCGQSSGKITFKDIYRIIGCSWLRYSGYGAKAMYPPQTTSNPQHLVLEWENTNKRKKTMHVVW